MRESRPAVSHWLTARGRSRLRNHKGLFTFLPVAGAELVGLQGIEHAQDLLRAAADGKIGHVDEADDVLWIHDESGALGHTLLRIQDAELRSKVALHVGEH